MGDKDIEINNDDLIKSLNKFFQIFSNIFKYYGLSNGKFDINFVDDNILSFIVYDKNDNDLWFEVVDFNNVKYTIDAKIKCAEELEYKIHKFCQENGQLKIEEFKNKPNIFTYIKVLIEVETDTDFSLIIPNYNLYKLEYNQDYKIELRLDVESAKDDIIKFLKDIKINSSKDFHESTLTKSILDYQKQLDEIGISSSKFDLLGGGNWRFTIDVKKITEEFL